MHFELIMSKVCCLSFAWVFLKVGFMLPKCQFAMFVAKTCIVICYVMHFDKLGLHTMVITFS
jgi:hypothetical protein